MFNKNILTNVIVYCMTLIIQYMKKIDNLNLFYDNIIYRVIQMFSTLPTLSTTKYQILETITSISRLITLSFKPKGTKIAIRDHGVVLCEPTGVFFGLISQGCDRFLNHDSREDIWVLNKVIHRFITWYIIPYRDIGDKEIYDGLINMTKYLCVAFKELQNVYQQTGTVVGTLQYFILLLWSVIDGTFSQKTMYNQFVTGNKSFLDDTSNNSENVITIYSTIFDANKLKNFWTRKELKTIIDLFNQCFRSSNEPDEILFEKIQRITLSTSPKIIEKQSFDDLIDNSFASETSQRAMFDEENDSTPSTPAKVSQSHNKASIITPDKFDDLPQRSTNTLIVDGHLITINGILTMMDNKFIEMLKQSVQGTNS